MACTSSWGAFWIRSSLIVLMLKKATGDQRYMIDHESVITTASVGARDKVSMMMPML